MVVAVGPALLGATAAEGEAVQRGVADVVKRLSPARRLDLIRCRIVYAGLEARLKTERILAYKAGAAVAGFLFGLVATPGKLPAEW